jgi:hypothetical protein
VVIVTEEPGAPIVAVARMLPSDVCAMATAAQSRSFASAGFTLFEGKTPQGGLPTVYECELFACRLPATRVEQLRASEQARPR